MHISSKILRLVILSSVFTIGTLVLHGCCTGVQKELKQEPSKTSALDINKIIEKESVIPVAIIGAGPAGLTAAIYTAPQYDTVVIAGGARASALTGSHKVENWPSMIDSGMAIVTKIKEQAEGRGARFIDQEVTGLALDQLPFEISLSDGSKIHALAIIVALGTYPRKLGIPGEEKFTGQGVSWCATCDATFYKDKEVAVVGGSDSSIEEAIVVAHFARSVTLIYRRDALRASAAMQRRLGEYTTKSVEGAPAKIKVIYDTVVDQVLGDDKNGVTGIMIRNVKSGAVEQLHVDGLFEAVGREPNTTLLEGKLKLDDNKYIILANQSQQGRAQESSVPGVFAAGDVAEPRQRYCQAIGAAGKGMQAGQDAINYLEEIGFTMKLAQQLRERKKA